MPRFFRRLAEGVFDLDDLRFRANELADFVRDATQAYGVDQTPPVAVGFSNGANIAAAMLLLRPETLSGALLLRPMVPLVPIRCRTSPACPCRSWPGSPIRSSLRSRAKRSPICSAGRVPRWTSSGCPEDTGSPGPIWNRLAMVRSFFSFAQTLTPAMVVSRRFAQPRVLGAAHPSPKPALRQIGRPRELRNYVMLSVALEQERLLIAERLLTEIERRHGLPHPENRELDPVIIDRFLAAYLPEAREGEFAPLALEYAFAPTLADSLDLLRDVVSESPDGCGSALYVHDLDTGVASTPRTLH